MIRPQGARHLSLPARVHGEGCVEVVSAPHLRHDGHELHLEFLDPSGSGQKNPFSGLNLGLVTVGLERDDPVVRFRLVTHGASDYDAPVVAFDSGVL